MSSIPRDQGEKAAPRPDLTSAEAIIGYIQQLQAEWPTPHEGGVYRPQEKIDRIWAAMDDLGLSAPASPQLPCGDGNFLVIVDDDQTCRALWRGFRNALRVVLQACDPDGKGIHPDGPADPKSFWLKGQCFGLDIEPTPFRLLQFVWDRWERGETPIPFSAVGKTIWHDRRTPYSKIKTPVSRVNTALTGCELGFGIETEPGSGSLTLAVPEGYACRKGFGK